MAILDYLPGLGTRSARKQWRELREDALELGVLAALFLTEWVKTTVLLAQSVLRGAATSALWWRWYTWALFAVLLTGAAVYRKRLARAAETAQETAEEVVSDG